MPPRKTIIGIAASLVIIFVIIKFSEVSVGEILRISASLFALFLFLAVLRAVAQGLRLYLMVRRYAPNRVSIGKALLLRASSEFFALTTIPFIADELARVAMLRQTGLETSTAASIAFSEMILDILVGGLVACLAGVSAVLAGSPSLGAVILFISVSQLTAILVFTFLTAGKDFGASIDKLFGLARNGSPRDKASASLEAVLKTIGPAVSALFTRDRPLLAPLVALTLIVMTTPALALYLLAPSAGVLGSLYAFHADNALGVIPVTVGGSGLTEAGVFLYLSGVLRAGSWTPVIVWRIATYYLTLLITGATVVIYSSGLLLGLRSRPNSTDQAPDLF